MAELTNIGKRTEEVQDIIDRMPTSFGHYVTAIASFLFLLLLLFGWLVKYPDVITGQVTINANQAPIKMVAMSSGRLLLESIASQSKVEKNQIIGHVENPAEIGSVMSIKKIMEGLRFPLKNAQLLYRELPRNVSLGEMTGSYFTFFNSIKQLSDFQSDKLFEKQELALRELIVEQEKVLSSSERKMAISSESRQLYGNFLSRDSILFQKKAISASDLDRTRINYVGAQDAYVTAVRDIATSKQSIAQTRSQLQEVSIQKLEKEQQINLEIATAYNDMMDNLRNWEQKYLFRAPMEGHIQFLKFWSNNQFVQSGEEVFTIIPDQDGVIGQVVLPTAGAGKVKMGQEVIVKLDDYPYMEYGLLMGQVADISLTSRSQKTESGEVQSYLATINFPDNLTTNYGESLDFRYEVKGTAEIVTQDRRLIQRLFDNLKYILKK